jgi:regulator of replication initiation timing
MNSLQTDESELDLDVCALSEVIKEITPLLQEHVGLYADLRRQFFELTVRKPDLSFAACKIAEFDGQESVNLQQLTMQLGLIGQLLRQLQFEREGAIKSSQEAIQALQAENDRLRSELSNYRTDDRDKNSRSDTSQREVVQVSKPTGRSSRPRRNDSPSSSPKSPWSFRANLPSGRESPE